MGGQDHDAEARTESDRDRDASVVACALEKDDLRERLERWQALGGRAFAGIVSTSSGLRLIFHADRWVEDELRELVALERKCCAFANWSVHSNQDEVAVDVTAEGDGAVAAVQTMFGGLRSSSPQEHRPRICRRRDARGA
jgi:hypothetical protein